MPANEHKGLASSILESKPEKKLLSIILVPGRVFEHSTLLNILGISVSETETVPYAARHDGKGLISVSTKKKYFILQQIFHY